MANKKDLTVEITLDLSQIERLFAEYLLTLSTVKRERRFFSHRLSAEVELKKFLAWMKSRKEAEA
jgi:hypothetical protein